MKTIRITQFGMLLSVALILSYLETLLPVIIAVPGIKIGLANIITMLILYNRKLRHTFFFMVVRVTLAGILFSGVSGILYSLAGGLCCITVMGVLKRFQCFSLLGVSMAGAIFHNVGQIIVALFVMENVHILFYLPMLCISGVISGLVVGYITYTLIKKYNGLLFKN